MATKRVAVFESGHGVLARPATVMVRASEGDDIQITNHTASRMHVSFYEGAPFEVRNASDGKSATVTILPKEDWLEGAYPYVIHLSSGGGQGTLARGESAPYVIIER